MAAQRLRRSWRALPGVQHDQPTATATGVREFYSAETIRPRSRSESVGTD
jgi:hypothetical protein